MVRFVGGVLLITSVAAHGYLGTPKARNVVDGNKGCPHCLAAGGPGKVYNGVGYQHGMCGNAWDEDEQTWNVPGEIQAIYNENQVIELSASISAHHLGYFDIQLCDKQDISEECFMNHRLMRVGCTDTNDENCYRVWKHPADYELGWITESLNYTGPLTPTGDVTYKWLMQLPKGVTCSHCVLRWHYYTTNSCLLYNVEKEIRGSEEFWNCADIQIRSETGELPPDTKASLEIIEKLKTEIPRNLLSSNLKELGLYYVCPARSLGLPEHYDFSTSSSCFASGMDADCDIIVNSFDEKPNENTVTAVDPLSTTYVPPSSTSITTFTTTTTTTSPSTTDTGCDNDEGLNQLCTDLSCDSCLWFINGNAFCYPWTKDTCDSVVDSSDTSNGKYYWCNKADRQCNNETTITSTTSIVIKTSTSEISQPTSTGGCTSKKTRTSTVTSYNTLTVVATEYTTSTDAPTPTDVYTPDTYELCHPRNCVNGCLWEVNGAGTCYNDWTAEKCKEQSNLNTNTNVNGMYIWCPNDDDIPPFHTSIPVYTSTTAPCATQKVTITSTKTETATITVEVPKYTENTNSSSTTTPSITTTTSIATTATEDSPTFTSTTSTAVTTTTQVSGENLSIRCGTTWTEASQGCGKACKVDEDCPGSEMCFADLPTKPCGDSSSEDSDSNSGTGSGLSTDLIELPPIEEDKQGNIRDNTDRRISYLTSWGLTSTAYDAIVKGNIDAYLLSFASWNSNGDIVGSDDILTIPDYDPYYLPTAYQTWSNVAFDKRESNMFVALGGATYEFMWDTMDTLERRQKIVKSLAALLNTKFPVYRKNLQESDLIEGCLSYKYDGVTCDMSKYQLAGYVTIDGLDFDYERASRLTEDMNDQLEEIIKLLIADTSVNWKHKFLSLTTYHVGADPIECGSNGGSAEEGCSYPGSTTHSGEVTSLLEGTKDIIDFYNVMTYDAGPDFRYDVSLENYARIVGVRSKIIMGITTNSQWGPDGRFTQTKENNLERATWQKVNGYGGFFVWTLGSNDASMSIDEQIEYHNDLVNAGLG